MSFVARTVLNLLLIDEVAGMVLLQSNRYHLRMEYALEGDRPLSALFSVRMGLKL